MEREIKLTVNGEVINLEGEVSLADFLRSKGVFEAMVGVEHNLQWIRREDWPNILLKDNDRLEIIRIMAGG